MDEFIKLNIGQSIDSNYGQGEPVYERPLIGVRDAEGNIHGLENLPNEGLHECVLNGNVVVCLQCGRVMAEIVDAPKEEQELSAD